MLAGFEHAGSFRLGDQHLDLFLCDRCLALLLLPKQPEHRLGRDVEEPNRRRRRAGQCRHQRRHGARDGLGMAQRQVLGNELADDQRQIGDGRKHGHIRQPAGGAIRHTALDEDLCELRAESYAGIGAGDQAHGRDADLDRRQETTWIGCERERAIGASAALLRESPQARSPRRDYRQLGKRKQPVEGYEDQHNGDFEHGHEAGCLSLAGPLLSCQVGSVPDPASRRLRRLTALP